MIHKLLTVLIVLFLTACAGQTVRDDSPASDLSALEANAKRHLAPRPLANGKLYCLEDSVTEGQRDECAAELEDSKFLSERDKAVGLDAIIKGIQRLRLSRNPCGFWKSMFQASQCKVENAE